MILVVTFLSFSVAALVIETRFSFLKPAEISPKKISFFSQGTNNDPEKIVKNKAKKKQKNFT